MIRKLWVAVIMLTLIFSYVGLRAQETTVLTIAVPQWFGDPYNKAYFDPFREAHPGVDVVVVPDTDNKMYPPFPAYSTIEEHLQGTTEYVSLADILYVTQWSISPESTDAGLWLNLEPLVAVEPSLDESQFYSAAWRAFRWNGGMWALPTSLEPVILMYDPAAFDEAGLSYPSANWTIDDYVNAAVTLTQRDQDGNPTQPGCWCDTTLMFYGLLGHGLVDADGNPLLDDPELAALLEAWATAQEQIYPQGGYSSDGVPLMISPPWSLSPDIPGNRNRELVIGELPGGVYGAQATGFAVSAGTANPELAFQLAKYLAENPISAFASFGSFSALRNAEVQMPENFSVGSIDELPPEQQQVLQAAVETGINGADIRYFDYVNQIIYQISTEEVDALTALQEAQQKALSNREVALNWKGTQIVSVATVVPTPSFGADEIVLNFGISQWMLPNQADWERLAREFAESDSQIGVVNVDTQGNDYESWQTGNDCFYLNYDPISPYFDSEYLALDPLMDADPNFDQNDLVPGALEELQLEGTTFGYPLSVQISALRYIPEQFENANVPLPQMNWTLPEFIDALQQLDATDQEAYTVAFAPRVTEATDWLMLIAAYGALPIDYRTDPITWNFTDPITVDAIRQALDLAKSGLVDYQKMGTFFFSGMQNSGALTAVTLTGGDNYLVTDDVSFVNYPQGADFPVMSLSSVGGGYIRSDTPNREACYRWISFVASHPELLDGVMPARLSAIDDPVTVTAQGESAVALYHQYVALAADPNTVNIPNSFGGTFESYFVHQFLMRAFDAYVLEDADLDQVLADAQQKADDFMTCAENVPQVSQGATQEEFEANSNGIEACIAQVDPEMAAERAEAMGDIQ